MDRLERFEQPTLGGLQVAGLSGHHTRFGEQRALQAARANRTRQRWRRLVPSAGILQVLRLAESASLQAYPGRACRLGHPSPRGPP